jgi:hypothetical protein
VLPVLARYEAVRQRLHEAHVLECYHERPRHH